MMLSSALYSKGGHYDQAFEQAGTPHGGVNLGSPAKRLVEPQRASSGPMVAEVSRKSMEIWALRARFLPGARPSFLPIRQVLGI